MNRDAGKKRGRERARGVSFLPQASGGVVPHPAAGRGAGRNGAEGAEGGPRGYSIRRAATSVQVKPIKSASQSMAAAPKTQLSRWLYFKCMK